MASIPLPALGIKPPTQGPDPIEQYSRLQAIRDLMQRGQLQQQQLQQEQALEPGRVQLQQEQVKGAQFENQQRAIDLQNVQKAQEYWTDPSKFQGAAKSPSGGGFAENALGIQSDDPLAQHINGMIQAGVNPTMGPNSALAMGKQLLEFRSGVLKQTADQQKVTTDGLATLNKILTPIAAESDAGKRLAMLKEASPTLEEASRFDPSIHQAVMTADPNHLDKITTMTGALKDITDYGKTQSEAEQEIKLAQQGGNQALADAKYRNIQTQMQQKQPVSPEDKAFVAAYEKQKTLVPTANINLQGGLMNNQAKDMAAENYFQTGQLPAGMRSPAMSAAIINRAAELHPGGATELAGNRAAYEANKKSYDNVTGTLDTLSAFEQSGLKNLKQFTDLASKLPDTGVPWINTPVRLLDKNLVGAQYMPAIEAARSVALREIARVTNDPKLSGSLTDSARGEVSSFSPTNATLPQIKHVVEVLQNDMANVHSSLAQQKTDIGTRLGIKPTTPEAGAAPQGTVTSTVTNHIIRIGTKRYQYKGSGDTSDMANYTELK